ncbi:hypothetical protein [Brumimicrobium oceani]|uniref:Uncharacterized protein n=1 Tax=Brumimicrobium oceani TaxID=2100725 RepID=A0A2U2X0B3_9FLAO|nr:hypothetical protein [Brumimicrobium oceani]PWH81213.1 hypothetical protein DIT68_16025 [Brumimicrobium oceani]
MKKIISICLILVSTFSFSQDNQNLEVSKIESGSYPVFKMLERGYEKYIFELAKKEWPVELFTNEGQTSKILIKRVGILDEFYTADLPAYPAYYFGGNAEICISVIDKKIYYYTWSAKSGATISYILTKEKVSTYKFEKETLDNYRRAIKGEQTEARSERIQNKAEIAALEAEENTLKGKSIKSISLKMIDNPNEIGHLTVVGIGIEVVLANGKTLKTKNLGGLTPYSDFEVQTKGGDYAGGDFKVANDSRKIPNDKIELVVSSKYSGAVKGTFSTPINYKNNIHYQYQGNGGAHGRGGVHGRSVHGGHGKDGRNVNATAEKQMVNGETITKVVFRDAANGQVLAEAKIHVNNKITLNVKGGNGGNGAKGHFSGDNGGNGGDGGNGGTVMLTGNGVSQLNIVIQNTGGNAGAGGAGNETYNKRGANGSRGRTGSVIK